MKFNTIIYSISLLLLVFSCTNPSSSGLAQDHNTAKGSLFIIGGGDRDDPLMEEMVKVAQLSEEDYIMVLPMASSEPDTTVFYLRKQFERLTPNTVEYIKFTKDMAQNSQLVDSVKNAKLIYIAGGDQSRFMDIVHGTPLFDAIHHAYQNGACIAGTSAGAAVMSKEMISGNQLVGDTAYKETFDKLEDKNIEFTAGLGLLDNAIIDQHFIKRSRYNRLFSALATHPSLACIGIDESTAIIVQGNSFRVVGESQVVVAKNPIEVKVNAQGKILFKDIDLSFLAEGDSVVF